MAETIFEIFDPVTGKTEGYRHGISKARDLIDRLEKYGHIRDYLPASQEGFYVVDTRGYLKSAPFNSRDCAQAKADFENMASDTKTYIVIEHRI